MKNTLKVKIAGNEFESTYNPEVTKDLLKDFFNFLSTQEVFSEICKRNDITLEEKNKYFSLMTPVMASASLQTIERTDIRESFQVLLEHPIVQEFARNVYEGKPLHGSDFKSNTMVALQLKRYNGNYILKSSIDYTKASIIHDLININEDNITLTFDKNIKVYNVSVKRPSNSDNSHYDIIQLIPKKNQYFGGVISNITLNNITLEISKFNKMQGIFSSDGILENITIKSPTIDSANDHALSLCGLCSGNITDVAITGKNKGKVFLYPIRLGGHSNIYIFKPKGYYYGSVYNRNESKKFRDLRKINLEIFDPRKKENYSKNSDDIFFYQSKIRGNHRKLANQPRGIAYSNFPIDVFRKRAKKEVTANYKSPKFIKQCRTLAEKICQEHQANGCKRVDFTAHDNEYKRRRFKRR